jgi:RTX calcium-binding nonapeptide repeat (4 copies)
MRITVSIAALTSLIALAALGAASASASVPVDLRVASNDGGNLADLIQYVPGSTTVKTLSGPDCFNPSKQSSGNSYTLSTPTMMGASWEAAQAEPALQPVRLSDADYASFGALAVCQVNAKTPPGFFFLKANHQALQVGADLFSVQDGDQLLAYRTPDDFSTDEELELSAPVRVAPGTPVTVNVRSYTSSFSSVGATVQPREAAVVSGDGGPATTDVNGNATLTFPATGIYQLTATGDYNDIPSQTLSVCVAAQPETECPFERGREILGSDEAETIKGTDGSDTIKPRGGNDVVKAGAGDDLITANGGGNDQIFCGGGYDTVTRDKKLDKVSKSCEVVNGKKAKKHKKHKKGKHRK